MRPQVVNKGGGIYSVTYTPESVGRYVIPVKYGGDEVPASPFNVRVAEVGDASKVKFIGECEQLKRLCSLNVYRITCAIYLQGI